MAFTPTMKTRSAPTSRFVPALVALLLTACHSWQPTTVNPPEWTPDEHPSSARVTLTNGDTVTILRPSTRNDSIVGLGGADETTDTTAVGVALQDVGLVEVRRFSVLKTAGLVVASYGSIVVGGVIFFVIACSGRGSCSN